MLDDMPKSQSVALAAHPEDAIATIAPPPASRGGKRVSLRGGREKVVRPSALGMLLRPIGIAVGVVLIAYAMVSLGSTFYRSYYRHLDHTAAVHPDRSVFDIFFGDKTLPPDAVDLVIRDVDGTLRKVVASKSEADKFVNETILMLDEERARIKQAAHEDLDRTFALAFQDREQAISGYADWFFEWKRSYVVLKETISSAIARFIEVGKYESVTEAIDADVKDYFLKNYKDQVLKPELRDQVITKGVEQAARHAHDSYRLVIANGDMRLQLFLAKHTSHLEDIPPATPMTNVTLDWDAQKWKAPVYLMQDRAFDGIAGLGAAAAGGTVGALALGPAINGVLAQSFGQLSRRVATSLGTRLAFAQQGAVAGTVVQPVGGQVVGAAIGVAIGAAVDYLSNAANEAINRESFVKANEQALDATIAAWKSGLEANLDTAIDKWFDDARASVVLASK
jgi:phosphoglycolate phosphatase-like HAD superfamily hydrolase